MWHLVFDNCEPAFLRQLVGKLKMFYYNRDMYIVKEGEITDCMYIVHSGRVLETSLNSTSTKTIIAGRSFGLIEGLIPETPFKNSYKTVLKSQILMLSYADWSYLLKHFPDSAEAIYNRLDFGDDNDYPPYKPPQFDYGRRTSTPFWDFDQTQVLTPSVKRRRAEPYKSEPHPNDSAPRLRQPHLKRQAASNFNNTTPQPILHSTVESQSEVELGDLKLDQLSFVVHKEETPDPHAPEADEGQDMSTKNIRRASKFIDPTVIAPSTAQLCKKTTITTTPSTESLQIIVELTPKLKNDDKVSESTPSPTTPSAPSSESLQGSIDLSQKVYSKGLSTTTLPLAPSSESLRGLTRSKHVDIKKLLDQEKDEKGGDKRESGKGTALSHEGQQTVGGVGWLLSWLSMTEQPATETSAPEAVALQTTPLEPLEIQPTSYKTTAPKSTIPSPRPTATQSSTPKRTIPLPYHPHSAAPNPAILPPKTPTTTPKSLIPQLTIPTLLSTSHATQQQPTTSDATMTTIHIRKPSLASAGSLTRSLKPASRTYDMSTALQREESYNSSIYPRPRRREESSLSLVSKSKGFHDIKAESATVASTETIASTSIKDSPQTTVFKSRHESTKKDLQRLDPETVLEEELEQLTASKILHSIVKEHKDGVSKDKGKKTVTGTVDFTVDEGDNDMNQGGVSKATQSARLTRRLIRVRYEEDKSKSEKDTDNPPRLITETDTHGDDDADTSLNSQRERNREKERKKKKES